MLSYINYKTQEVEKRGTLPNYIRLDVNEMSDLLGIPNNGKKYKLADESTKELGRVVMYCYDRKTGDIKRVVIFPEIIYRDSDNSIEINTQIFNYALMRRQKDNFTICTLKDAKSFRSVYSARISDYLRMEAYGKNMIGENINEIEVDLTELKLMSGVIVLDKEVNFAKIAEIVDNIPNISVENKYPEWKRFKEKILDKAIRDINNNTDMIVSYKTKRSGRGGKTNKVIFHVEKKNGSEAQIPNGQIEYQNKTQEQEGGEKVRIPEPSQAKLFEMCMNVNQLLPFPVDFDTCMTLLSDAQYNVAAIETAVNVLNQNGRIENSIGFLRRAIQEHWEPGKMYKGKKPTGNWFNDNMEKREYSKEEMNDLERMLLNNPIL